MEVGKDPLDVRRQRCGRGNPSGSDGQSAQSVGRTGLHQVSDFRQDAEQGRVHVTSRGLVRTVRSGHGQASQLLVSGNATQTSRDEPFHANPFTVISHDDTVCAVAVVGVRFRQPCC
ncbi:MULTISPECIES: hypothetical protein [Streptomyces]|uniref:hypothetical protein n=1 Tax=Streptomyces TaxID=1883 RepID=UPI001180F64A|nr:MULTISPECIES: hypothetical protein [Streptomyces]MDX3637066.1 hypothetical protein [Streptomyces europaeiscabiei]MDX3655210.1 hypothetical protein [Streptomyces europaeiscabiei]WRZ53689.1 hypothetical protein OG622_45840 [Streptomyces sp. NBC_01314]